MSISKKSERERDELRLNRPNSEAIHNQLIL